MILRWGFISDNRADFGVQRLCRVFQVSRSGFYRWIAGAKAREVRQAAPQRDVPGHSFVIRDDRMVTVETTHAEMVVTDPRDVALYVAKFEQFAATALADDAMRGLEGLRDEFLREQETP